MSQAAHDLGHEFWRPPIQDVAAQDVRIERQACARCNTEFLIGARFCHVCGASRGPEPQSDSGGMFARLLDFQLIRNAFGFTIGSFIAFVIGIVCVAAAVLTGFVYTTTTLLDWQAVQLWRIEWLLAATVAMLAGVLLRKN